MLKTDILIVGCGIIGLSIARELRLRFPDLSLILLEKEKTLACHSSGRNSGVLHAGFYYSPDSLKARLTAQGNKLLTDYCLEYGLAINRCGKVVVTKHEAELASLYELKSRGDRNGVTLHLVDEKELQAIEPNAKTFHNALFSPATSTVNPKEVVFHIAERLREQRDVQILLNQRFINITGQSTANTGTEKIQFKYLINASGLYTDKVAQQFGVGHQYTLLPFKGLYMAYSDSSVIGRHIYPVPNLKNPFLGVHFTITVDGKVKIGPTAIPAFWRENYHGLDNFRLNEFLETVTSEARLFYLNNFGFRDIAFEEMKKYFKPYLIQQASALVKKIDLSGFKNYLEPGIRAQLVDKEKMELVMDFIVKHSDNSTHILNAVSPALTCAFSFSRYVVDEVQTRLN
jgi:L-2-hydroxyglutarate oxidase LhgO